MKSTLSHSDGFSGIYVVVYDGDEQVCIARAGYQWSNNLNGFPETGTAKIHCDDTRAATLHLDRNSGKFTMDYGGRTVEYVRKEEFLNHNAYKLYPYEAEWCE